MQAELAEDLAKAQSFLQYVENKLPGITGINGSLADLTQQLKDQAEQNGGISPFKHVFDIVR